MNGAKGNVAKGQSRGVPVLNLQQADPSLTTTAGAAMTRETARSEATEGRSSGHRNPGLVELYDNMQGPQRVSPLPIRRTANQTRLSQAKRILRHRTAMVVSLAVLGLAAMLLPPPSHAQSASTWNKRGADAEAREDYDAAFEAYRQAHLKKPKDLRYKVHYERLRFQAANVHVDRGRVLRQSGDMSGAASEFARALQIDPGNQAAAQELQLTESPGAGGVAANSPNKPAGVLVPGIGEQTPYQNEVKREISSLSGPVVLQPVSDDPITLDMVEDAKVIYQSVGKAAGLNVIFDPDYQSKRIPVKLNSVSLRDSLRIIGTLSGSYWKPVTSNTIFVAQNNPQKRRESEDLSVQTFYLTNVSQQNDANEIQVALRNLLDPGVKVFLAATQNAIIMRATTDELLLAEKVINDLDRTRSEVVIDVAVLEVSRQKERSFGITLPTTFGLTPTQQTANATTGTTTTTVSGTSTASTTVGSNGLTLNGLGNLNATNFSVNLTGGQVSALLSDSDTRILQNPRIRATDGQRATLKIGSKIPVATGSYSAGAAITTASLGVQTQFTYLDVGVNIDITPTVHYDREISLKLKIEVSSQNGSVTISGVTEPIIAQKVDEQVIQLKDGEPSILAGILTKQDTNNLNGTPGLGEIPLIKYFFSTKDKTTQQDEIVFLLIPHIVREQILTDQNTRPIFTGSGQSIDLMRRVPTKATVALSTGGNPAPTTGTTSAANAAAAMVGKMAADAQPISPTMAAALPRTAVAPGQPVTLTVTADPAPKAVGSTFQVKILASNAHDLSSVPLQMQFDPRLLTLVNVDSGDFLSKDGQAVAMVHRDEGNGAVTISASRPPNTRGVDGDGNVCTLTFRALSAGDATLALVRIGAKDSNQNSLPAIGSQAVVHVK